MPAPQAVLDLIERFERNREAYKSPSYNETQLRREFLDPFFEALGWDVNNRQGYPRLREIYYKADARYNSGLFHFRHEKDVAEAPDKLTLDLVIDDKPLKEILRNLYYPDSPYDRLII